MPCMLLIQERLPSAIIECTFDRYTGMKSKVEDCGNKVQLFMKPQREFFPSLPPSRLHRIP